MDWTEAEARLATLEREVTRHQRLAREQQALARHDGRGAALGHGPGHERWLGRGHWLRRRFAVPAAPALALGALTAMAARVAGRLVARAATVASTTRRITA
jgi:hypothetical protein